MIILRRPGLGRALVGLLACALVVARTAPASAGLLNRQLDLVCVTPFTGAQWLWRGSLTMNGPTGPDLTLRQLDAPLVVGIVASVRLGGVDLGVVTQRIQVGSGEDRYALDVVSGQLGLNGQIGPTVLQFGFRGGLAFVDDGSGPRQGYAGGLSLAWDVFPLPILSLGVGAAAETQMFWSDANVTIMGGVSITGRLALHL